MAAISVSAPENADQTTIGTGSITSSITTPDSKQQRLAPWIQPDRISSWIWTGLVGLLALVLRFTNISFPPYKIFDETYYATDAWSILHNGYELNLEGNAPGLMAHPPLGKWCIALGELLFGYNSFGWRFSAAIAGTISVIVLCRVARRLFRSTLLGCIAGLLLALDGLHFVMSRSSLLDIFLMLFVLLAFACLVMDRQQRRTQIFAALTAGIDMAKGLPHRTKKQFPIWRLLCAIMLGLACGVKWSGLYYIPLFILLFFVWEIQLRRSAGVQKPILETISWEANWVFIFLVAVIGTYLLTWTGWFVTDGGWNRHGVEEGSRSVWYLPDALAYLWDYHAHVYQFHVELTKNHSYQSTPYSWFTLGRPVLFYYESDGSCGAQYCSSAILALGTPILWWSFLPALVVTAWRWLARRDWRAGAILLTAAAGVVPWMFYPERTMFYFYSLPSTPFFILAVVLVLGMVLGKTSASSGRKLIGITVVAIYVAIIAASFIYFYPIYTGEVIPYDSWHDRMWFESWI